MDCIKHLLRPHAEEISKSDNPQAALVYKMYDILLDYLESILHLNWMTGKGKLAIVGGIMINGDGVGTDRFMPLKFEMWTRGETVDLFEEAFGPRPANPFLNSLRRPVSPEISPVKKPLEVSKKESSKSSMLFL